MSVINATPLLAAAGGDYQISRSVRLRSSASAYFNRTPASAGNRKTWTWSGWVKRGTINSSAAVAYPLFAINSANNDSSWFDVRFISDQLYIGAYTLNYRITTQVFRDPSAWYHVVIALDTTQATANNRLRVYVNGVEITAFSTTNNPTQNADLAINLAAVTYIGATGGERFDGYLTEINFIDGQALTPSSFGETDAITGVWKPKKYAGTYGTNGFYLNFSDNSSNTATTIGKDYSGNGNNWTPNNISVTAGVTYDSMIDVPTLYADGGNGRGNYCVINPLDVGGSGVATLSNANLKATGTTSVYRNAFGTMRVTSGLFYFEVTVDNFQTDSGIGIKSGGTEYLYLFNGNKTNGTSTSFGATWTTGDVIGVAFDISSGKIWWAKNGTRQASGDPAAGTNAAFTFTSGQETVPDAYLYGSTAHSYNFGQRPFAYTPPTGFKALNTQNLPAPTILKGNQYFDVSLYTGNATARSITGVGFRPDFVWTKSRSGAESHRLYDAVRGATQSLYSNLTNAEATEAQSLTAFNSDGFSLGTGAPNSNAVTYAAWNWKESVSAGFDIVTWTGNGLSSGSGPTVSHNLGVAPKFIIAKSRSAGSTDWIVNSAGSQYGTNFGYYLKLNTTAAISSGAGPYPWWTVGSSNLVPNDLLNASSTTYVAYLFSEVAGFSKFGSYTGNGSADGPFVFCGFRPRWVMIKRTDSSTNGNWLMVDTTRDTGNVAQNVLFANLSNAEATGGQLDNLSNGFKIRTGAGSNVNESGGTYIFAAFAEHPFKNSLAR